MNDDGMEVEVTQPIVKQIITDLSRSLSDQAAPPSINIVGAAKSLFALLNSGDEAAKEILLRIPPSLLQILVTYLSTSVPASDEEGTRTALITLLCEWCTRCPTAVHSFLSFPDSIALIKLLKSDDVEQNGLVTLLFGTSLEHFGDSEHSGWTRQTVLELIQTKIGISNFTNMLEAARKTPLTSTSSTLESQLTQQWYSDIADTIRRRLVKEVTRAASNVAEENPLNSVIQQQTTEIEELKKDLEATKKSKEDAEAINASLLTKINVVMGGDSVSNVEEEARLKRAEETLTVQIQDLNTLLSAKDGELEGLNKIYQALEAELHDTKSTATSSSQDAEVAEKLKEKLRQGDAWMKMAQEKMEELGGRNMELEDIVSRQGNSGDGTVAQGSSLTEKERSDFERLKDNARSSDVWMKSASAKIDELAAENEKLQTQLADNSGKIGEGEWTNKMALHQEITSLRKEKEDFVELVAKMQALEGDEVALLKANATSADEWMKAAQENLTNLGEENKRLEASLQETSNGKGVNNEALSAELSSLTKEKEQAMGEVAKFKANAASADEWMKAAQENLTSLGKENNDLLANLNTSNSIIENLKNEKQELEERTSISVKSLKDEIATLSFQTSTLQQKLSESSTIDSTGSSSQNIERFDSIDLSSPSPSTQSSEGQKLHAVIQDLEQKLSETENTMVKVQERNAKMVHTIEEEREEMAQKISEIVALKEKAGAADAWMAEANTNMARMQEELNAKGEASADTAELTSKISALESEKSELDTEIVSLMEKAGAADAWMAEATSNMAAHEAEKVEREEDIASLSEQIGAANAWMQEATTNMARMQEELRLKGENDASSHASLESELQAARNSLTSIQSTLDIVETEKTTLVATLAAKASEIEALQQQSSALVEAHKKEVEEQAKLTVLYKSEAEAVSSAALTFPSPAIQNALEQRLKGKEEECRKLSSTIAEFQKWSSNAQSELQNKELQIASLAKRIDEISIENINLKDTVNETKSARLQMDDIISEHVRAKIGAEDEVRSLKSDLEFLAKSNASGVQEKLLMARQEEEERVKSSTRRELQELRADAASHQANADESRRLHRICEEQLSTARLKIGMLEREMESLRADETFMKETVDRVKGRHAEVLAGIKARITSLEREREELLNSHVNEMRGMRKEVQKLEKENDELRRMGEDRQQEIEILNSTLTGEEVEGEKEIERLRYEKAQLLASARKTASGFERKLREATSVAAGRRKAEFIAVKEAKESCESRVAQLLGEIGELKTTLAIVKDSREKGREGEYEAMGTLRVELDKVKSDNEVLRVENSQLTQRISANFEEMERSNVIMNERCRIAEMRLKQVEDREKEGLLRMERVKLREEGVWDGGEAELVDELDQLRGIYEDLEAEHEDLLALLAQQQIEKEQLKHGLLNYGGEDAVQLARREAEEICVERFSQFIEMP